MADKFWKEPELPPVQKLPRKKKKPPSYGGRIFVGVVGAILLVSCAVGIWGAINDKTGARSPFAALAGLLPAVVALTGQIKVN
jgi:hypothetical protein